MSSVRAPPACVVSAGHAQSGATLFAGLTSTIICFPLETVRTRLAVAPQGQFHGMVHCARQIVSREGFGALFKVQLHCLLYQKLLHVVMLRYVWPGLCHAYLPAPFNTLNMLEAGYNGGQTILRPPVRRASTRA